MTDTADSRQSRSFRLVCGPSQVDDVEDLLRAQGFSFAPDPFYPLARRLVDGPLALGSSLAAYFGYIYIQDRSSMLPPLALNPPPGAAVLDMCASPGSKTGLLGMLAGEKGFILGNEPSKKRLGTLRRNLQAQNLLCCATASHPGEKLPLPGAGGSVDDPDHSEACPGWSHILLDPPCSGWGTADKHPQVMRLWRGDKLRPLADLQRRLLAEAARLLRPGGLLAYSTCTTNAVENEEQILFARDSLGLEPLALEPVAAFDLAPPALPGCPGVWRVESGGDGQGFFVALLRKSPDQAASFSGADGSAPGAPYPGPGPEPGPDPGPVPQDAAQSSGAFFVRPWDRHSPFAGERRRFSRARRGDASARAACSLLAREALAGPWLDPELLPPGDVAVFSGVAHFLPAARRGLLPPGFAWKGFPLGRLSARGELRSSPYLRRLMPPPEGRPALVLEDAAPILALLAGQSPAVDAPGPEIGLYYKTLPLCRLQVKGRRAVLPPQAHCL